jgi:hypothetical protein
VFIPCKKFQPSLMYYSSLLDPFVSYKESEVM